MHRRCSLTPPEQANLKADDIAVCWRTNSLSNGDAKEMQMTALPTTDALTERDSPAHSRHNSLEKVVMANAPAMRVRVLKSDEEIESIRDLWKSKCTHPHADPDFFQLFLRTSPKVESSYVLCVENGSEVTALLIGRVEKMKLDVHLGYARLPQPTVRALVFIYGGLLGSPSPEECKCMVEAVDQALKAGIADIAFFNHLRTDSNLYRLLIQHPGFCQRDRFADEAVHRSITIPNGTETLWKQFPYKARGKFKWNKKTFLSAHKDDYAIEYYSKPSDLETMVQKVEVVAEKTYQRSLGVGFGASPAELERLRFKAENGWLQVYILTVNGAPAAFFCGTLYDGILHADHMGFDPALRTTSPGIFLTLSVVEKFCELQGENRVQAIDFGLGDARYKADLCNVSWNDASLCLFAPTWRGLALNAYRTPVKMIDRAARKIFNPQLQQKIKTNWRNLRRKKNTEETT